MKTRFLQTSKMSQRLPCSANHNCLGPGLHDLQEGAIVKETTQPLSFLTWKGGKKAISEEGGGKEGRQEEEGT